MRNNIKKILYYFPRKLMTKIRFFYVAKKRLDLKNPKDFNEKIIYLMLNEFGKKETECADKFLVRKYVEKKGLKENLVKLYAKFDSVDEINFEKLPKEYVLKTNHGCGCTIIKREDENIDINRVRYELKKSLKRNYAKENFEYHYEKIKPCIICEEYLKDGNKTSPIDYKFFCFNGRAKFILVCGNRFENVQKVYYDLNWKKEGYTKIEQSGDFDKPQNFEEMIKISERLAEDFKFVRVDLYNIKGRIYFGELTFTPRGGINNTIKENYLEEWGKLINL